MSLNDVILSPYLLTQLYPTNLIEVSQKTNNTTTSKTSENFEWKSLGNNQKRVLIGVRYPGIPYLPDAQLDFLKQLLMACQLSLNDVAVINIDHYKGISLTQLTDHFTPQVLLLFGIRMQELGDSAAILPYQIQQISEYKATQAPALHDLQNNKEAKRNLWASLKTLFNI